MRAELPYHFCEAPGCETMTPIGSRLCALHLLCLGDGDFFPEIENLSPDASQELTPNTITVPGDADSHQDSTP